MEETKRLEVGKILTKTFLVYKEGFRQFIGLSAVSTILILCLAGFEAALPRSIALALCILVLIIASFYVSIRGSVSIYKLTESLSRGIPMTFKESFRSSDGHAGTYFAVALMYCFITIIPMLGVALSYTLVENMILKCGLILLFGIPFLFLYIRYYLAIPSALLSERMNGEFKSSKQLVKGDFWRVLIIMVLTYGIFILIGQIPEPWIGSAGSNLWLMILALVVSCILQVFTTPIGSIAAALTYLDLNGIKAVDTLAGKAGGQDLFPEIPAKQEQIN